MLGVLPGIVGSLQASEALKLILGTGETLTGRLLLFDALYTTFDEVSVQQRSRLPRVRRPPTITEYVDYVEFCAGAGARMTVTVRIPPTLRAEVGGAAPGRGRRATPCARSSTTSSSAIRHSARRSSSTASIATFVNVYLGGEDVRTLDGLDTPVAAGADRDPAAGDGRWLDAATLAAGRPLAARPRRQHAARRAAADLAEADGQDLREARGPEPDRLDQGPRREVDDRGRRGLRRARAGPAAARADLGQHRASRSR